MRKLAEHLMSMPKAMMRAAGVTAAHGATAASASARTVVLFVAVVLAVSIFGGYQLTHMTYRISNASALPQRGAEQLLAVEESLDEASINFGRQIQEWKDMLLRINREDRYNAHWQAFIESSIGVQKALHETRMAMERLGLGTEEVEQLSAEHRALFWKYVSARGRLDLRRPESARLADQQVMGIDREFQRHMATIRGNVEFLAKQQLSGTASADGRPYLLLGLLGTFSLLFMAFIGFAFASGFGGLSGWAREHSYS